MKPLALLLAVLTLASCTGHYEYVSHDPSNPYYRAPVTVIVRPATYAIPVYETECFDRQGRYVPAGQHDPQRGDRCVLRRIR